MNRLASWTIFKRELKSYFESPVAYVFMVVFLVLLGALTFFFPGFPLYERGVADLDPFFLWHPIVFVILVPAATMGLWSEERRTGTIELLLTMPVTNTQVIMGKFFASWVFIIINLLLTIPIVFTVEYLGNPDMGVICCGYLGSIIMAGAYVSVGMLTSAFTKSQVIAFVVSWVLCFVFVLSGTPFITDFFVRWAPRFVEIIAAFSFWTHFESIKRGVIDIRDIFYYASVIVFMIVATHVVLDNRKSA
jgi:ABC-2 type transport system permease protein